MDRQGEKKVIKAINQFAVTNYVQHLLMAKYKKITLFPAFARTGAPNISQARNILMLKKFPALMKLFGKNVQN